MKFSVLKKGKYVGGKERFLFCFVSFIFLKILLCKVKLIMCIWDLLNM